MTNGEERLIRIEAEVKTSGEEIRALREETRKIRAALQTNQRLDAFPWSALLAAVVIAALIVFVARLPQTAPENWMDLTARSVLVLAVFSSATAMALRMARQEDR